ncbi:MAG: class I SAM-dependent methyltransferase [Gammaproteobacteria bacterium]|nr:class I SAM-dependent methyltransferase [Gammaproteobacteria bacterium]
MTFLSKEQTQKNASVAPVLSQRGRAGMELLGSIQNYSSGQLRSLAKQQFESQLSANLATSSIEGSPTQQARRQLVKWREHAESLSSYRYERFIQRYVAEDVYCRGIPAVEEQRDTFERLASTSLPKHPQGSLQLDPSLDVPRYYDGVEWHLEPGGYDGYDLYGALFTYVAGPCVFKYGGYAAVAHGEDITRHRVDVVSQLKKSSYARVYEPGCGGFSTLAAVHNVFPQAELVGCDLSPLLLTNGHIHAERVGVKVTFKQRDARETGEPDAAFDAVIMYALLHEMPPDAGVAALREAFRILQPGGEIVISDPPPFRAVPAFNAVLLDWDTKHRGEPFFSAVGHFNWSECLQDIGFADVDEYALGPDQYPWVTRGVKPE